jgi:hypothetical protein
MPELTPSEALKKAGTRFPFINLKKALERAKLLFDADNRGRELGVPAAFAVWGYSGKSSGGFQTIAALKAYGLLKEGGGADARKIGLSEEALRYFRDERSEEKAKLRKLFALKPKLVAALWMDWGATPPADTIARSHLKTEAGLNDQSARSLLAVYKENIAFAEIKGTGKIPENREGNIDQGSDGEADHSGDLPPPPGDRNPITRRKMGQGMKEATFPLDEGLGVVQWPEPLSEDSYVMFEQFVKLALARAKSSIAKKTVEAGDDEIGENNAG